MHTYDLPNGHTLEVYEPPSSSVEPMMRGRCPGCREQLLGFRGRHGAVRELDRDGLVTQSVHATSYGHITCVEDLFDSLVAQLDASSNVSDLVPFELAWTWGTQREMLNFVQRYEHATVEVTFDHARRRTTRYGYRLQEAT